MNQPAQPRRVRITGYFPIDDLGNKGHDPHQPDHPTGLSLTAREQLGWWQIRRLQDLTIEPEDPEVSTHGVQ